MVDQGSSELFSLSSDPRARALDFIATFSSKSFLRPTRSPIEADADVAIFLAERFGLMSIDEIISACRAEFGSDRTPSKSAAHRFWVRLRAALGSQRVLPK